MGFFDLQRVPESEVMDDAREVQAYSSAAAQRHLDRIDDTFVALALRLVQGLDQGAALGHRNRPRSNCSETRPPPPVVVIHWRRPFPGHDR